MHTASLESREHILIGYGEVMSIVQRWEQALALVWWRVGRKHKNGPTGDFDTPRSQREIMRLEAAFLRTPAQQVRATVAPHPGRTGGACPPYRPERSRARRRRIFRGRRQCAQPADARDSARPVVDRRRYRSSTQNFTRAVVDASPSASTAVASRM
jgi:hypothetical protein